jgi:hypothetical protein
MHIPNGHARAIPGSLPRKRPVPSDVQGRMFLGSSLGNRAVDPLRETFLHGFALLLDFA